MPRIASPPLLRLSCCVLLASGAACAAAAGDSPSRRLEGAVLDRRFTEGRLAGQRRWSACAPPDTARLIPVTPCAEKLEPSSPSFARIHAEVRAARRRMAPDSSVRALHAWALLDLRLSEDDSAARDGAVESLTLLARRATGDPGLLNDLAVANLALAQRRQELRPLLRALDAVERAVQLDSTSCPALFNRALVLERLYLVSTAETAWERYVAVEPDPRWRDEGRSHLAALRRRRKANERPAPVDSMLARHLRTRGASTLALARDAPQSARETAFTVFHQLGLARMAGDGRRATELDSMLRTLGRSLAEAGGDASIALAAAPLQTEGADEEITRAFIGFGEGLDHFAAAQYARAAQDLALASRRLHRRRSPLAGWSDFYLAAALVSRGDYERGDVLLLRLLAHSPPAEAALIGKTKLALGVSRLRRGDYERALLWYRSADEPLARSRELPNAGLAAYLRAEAYGLAGEYGASEDAAFRSLRILSSLGHSNYLANLLDQVVARAHADRLGMAALAVEDEALLVARDVGKPEVLALARCARARELWELGRRREAAGELAEAGRLERLMGDEPGLERIRANIALTRGQLLREDDPSGALPFLATATAGFRRFRSDHRLSAALYETAEAARAAGDRKRSRGLLAEAISLLERQDARFSAGALRWSFDETVEHVLDAMIASDLADGRADSALAHLERSRVLAWPSGLRPSAAVRGGRGASSSARIRQGTTLVAYAMLRDELVIWTATSRGVTVREERVTRDSLVALIEWNTREIARSDGEPGGAGSALFDLLLRPIEPALRGQQRVVIIPDRELNRVAFAALRDRSGRYAAELYELSTAPSVAFHLAAASRGRPTRRTERALVIGDPALDANAARGLTPLPGAANEAMSIGRLYPGSTLLLGAAARRSALLALAPAARIVHFAGHAVFDPDRPDLSYLALSAGAPGDDGKVRGREIANLRLSKTSIVVLSACSTFNPRASHAGAIGGLAYSFLRAGAPAIVSSLWDVSDDATTALLVQFHRELSAGVPAARALRIAQLQAIRSPSPSRRAPRNWAAFTYTGP